MDYIADVICERAAAGKNYGILVVPEGLPEFISDIKAMIDELSNILGKDEEYIHSLEDHSERVQYMSATSSPTTARGSTARCPATFRKFCSSATATATCRSRRSRPSAC